MRGRIGRREGCYGDVMNRAIHCIVRKLPEVHCRARACRIPIICSSHHPTGSQLWMGW